MERDWRYVIFSRYIGQYQQATEENATKRKSSEDIQHDLLAMAKFSVNEISEYMVEFQYSLGFSDESPVWLMRESSADEIEKIEE